MKAYLIDNDLLVLLGVFEFIEDAVEHATDTLKPEQDYTIVTSSLELQNLYTELNLMTLYENMLGKPADHWNDSYLNKLFYHLTIIDEEEIMATKKKAKKATTTAKKTTAKKTTAKKTTAKKTTAKRVGGAVDKFWDLCNKLYGKHVKDITRKMAIDEAVKQGLNKSTASTQWHKWKTDAGL